MTDGQRGTRLNVTGPKYPDGKPIGTACRDGCRLPRDSSTDAHCRACHNTFGGIGFFDLHRQDGWCIQPASLGLILDRDLWATEEGHAKRRATAERAAIARAGRK